MAMTEASREVGVVVRRRSIDNPWIDQLWSPAMILDEVPATAPWTVLSTEADATTYYAGSASIDLFSAETANYRDNLADGAPRIWVALRRQDGGAELELTKVTADPTEGEAMFESGCDVIGTVPMPPEIASWIAAFVDRFHVERVFHKRKRDRAAAIGPACRAAGRMREQDAHERSGRSRRDKGFLARWSQRKQEAKQPEPKPDAPAARTRRIVGPPALQGEDATPEFDLSSLPKLEELTGSTDITAFLRKACPNICGMRPCENPGRWIPRFAITSIPRSNMPMTGIRRAEFRRRRTRRRCRCRADGVADHGRTRSRNRQIPTQIRKMRRHILRRAIRTRSVGKTAARSAGAVAQTIGEPAAERKPFKGR